MKRLTKNHLISLIEVCATNGLHDVAHTSVCRLLRKHHISMERTHVPFPVIFCLLAVIFAIASTTRAKDMPVLYGSDTLTAEIETIHVGENRTVSYAVTNSTEKLLIIEDIESSCDCMTVLEHPSQIEPQGVGKVRINLFGEEKGTYAFAVALQFEDGSQRYLIAQVIVKEKSTLKEPPASVSMAPPRVGKKWYPGKPKPIVPEVMRRVTRSSDRSLYTSLESVQSRVLNKTIRVIDLRTSDKYQRCRLPDSLNMTPVEARAKSFLKNGQVLLVDEGWGRRDTERACAAIRKAGNAGCHILFGGINAWVHSGNRTDGPGISPGKLTVITPREFLAVRGLDSWVVLTENETTIKETQRWLPETVAALPELNSSAKRLLLLGSTHELNNRLPENTVLFTLEGGIAAIEEEYRRMTAMRYTQTRKTSSRISSKRWQILKSGCGCGG